MRVLDPRFAAASAALGAALVLLARRRARRPRRVVITGGCGNLGSKLAAHLLRSPEDWSVVLLEHPAFHSDAKVAEGATCVLGDLADGGGAWAAALRGADAVVHFSAVNPYPNASWEESAASMLHTFNVLLLAERAGVRRVVLASSNHVMGGYKEKRSHGLVRPADPPACGTPLRDPVLAASGDAVACFLFSRGVSFVGAPRCVRGRGRLRGRQAHGRAAMHVAVYFCRRGSVLARSFLLGEQLCKSLAATRRGLLPGPSYYMLRIGVCPQKRSLCSTQRFQPCSNRFQPALERTRIPPCADGSRCSLIRGPSNSRVAPSTRHETALPP